MLIISSNNTSYPIFNWKKKACLSEMHSEIGEETVTERLLGKFNTSAHAFWEEEFFGVSPQQKS
jgi:hypothetical protein